MLQELWQGWVAVVTKPRLETFEQERLRAGLDKAVVGILLAGLVVGIVSALGAAVGLAVLGPLGALGDEWDELAEIGTPTACLVGSSIFVTPILAVVVLFVTSGIFFLLGRLFGGMGSFTNQTYLVALVLAPAMVVSNLVGVLPCIGCLRFLILVYALYPLTLALQSAHSISAGKAVAVWLGPLVVVFLLALCILVALGVAIASLVG